MPARKRLSRAPKKVSKFTYFRLIAFSVLTLLMVFAVSKIAAKKYLSDVPKINIAVQEVGGDVSVVIFDFENAEITRVIIPGNTEVESAQNLGTFKLKKIWQLGLNEKVGGELLSKTLTKYFKFPNYVWADNEALGFISTNPFECLKPSLIPFKTNLSLGDKVALTRFCMRVANINHTEIDLSKSSFIKKDILTDGEEGFVLSGLASPKLYANFNYFAGFEDRVMIAIKDGSGNPNSSKVIGEITEIIGAKVASITKVEGEKYTCIVKAKDIKIAEIISNYFSCKVSNDLPDVNFNAEIDLGLDFPKRF